MLLHPDEGSLDHVVPRSRGGADMLENTVWSAKEANQRKADRLPHEAGIKLLTVPRAPKELPVTVYSATCPTSRRGAVPEGMKRRGRASKLAVLA